MGNTLVDLVNDLEVVLDTQNMTQARRRRIVQIQKDAKSGAFHDFLSQDATPKMNLRARLCMDNLQELGDKVVDGEYDDEQPEDARQ